MSTTWIIAANNMVYDHTSSFEENGYIDWHQCANFSVDDVVYIYCTSPFKKVKYQTRVTRVGMDFSEITDDKKFWRDLERFEKSKEDKYCRLVLTGELLPMHFL